MKIWRKKFRTDSRYRKYCRKVHQHLIKCNKTYSNNWKKMHGYPLNRSLNRACINKQDNWQMKIYDEKQNIENEFTSRVNIYKPLTPFNFDLRGYKHYLADNKIEKDHITEDIVKSL